MRAEIQDTEAGKSSYLFLSFKQNLADNVYMITWGHRSPLRFHQA